VTTHGPGWPDRMRYVLARKGVTDKPEWLSATLLVTVRHVFNGTTDQKVRSSNLFGRAPLTAQLTSGDTMKEDRMGRRWWIFVRQSVH